MEISGITGSSYTLVAADANCYISVKATGTGSYNGTTYEVRTNSPVNKIKSLTISNTTTAPVIGQTITTTLNPSNADVTWKWYRKANTVGSDFLEITGATNSSYTVAEGDKDCFLKVTATAQNNYNGELSAQTMYSVNNLTAITLSNVNPKIGEKVTTTIAPSVGTATYQWYRKEEGTTNYVEIDGATESSYTLISEDAGHFLKVVATATDPFLGEVSAETTGFASGVISDADFEYEDPTAGAIVGKTITVNTTPEGAVASYQWYRGKAKTNIIDPIYGATSQTYTVTEADLGYYLKVTVTGAGKYFSGTANKTTATYITQPISGISILNTEIKVGVAITTKQDPSLSTSTYQWYYGTDSADINTLIVGANESHYIPTADQLGGFFRIEVTGTGYYTGTVGASTAALGATNGKASWDLSQITLSTKTPAPDSTITATLTPADAAATATWQWYRGTSKESITEVITGANTDTYSVTADDYGYYLKVTATGTGSYTGSVSASTSAAITQNVSPLTLSDTTPSVGQTLSANLDNTDDQVTWQWYRGADPDNISMMIYGATNQDFTVTETDRGYYLKVIATGKSGYTGTVSASSTAVVPVIMIDAKLIMTLDPNQTTDSEIALPNSVTNALKGQTVYAEIWVKNATVSDKGINGGYVDISFDSTKIKANEDADALQHGSIYNYLGLGKVDNANNLIDDFGGAYLSGGQANTNGITKWVRLGYATFTTQEVGDVTLELKEGDMEFAAGLDTISWESVRFTNATLTVEATCNYDLDNSGVIDLADFHAFSAAYGSVLGDANWNVNCDFDKDGKIAESDFQWFQNAYGKNVADLVVDTDFPQPGKDAPTTPWTPDNSDTPTALISDTTDPNLQISVIWRSALSENESAATLPDQTEFILRGEKVYAEIWVKNTDPNAEGISGGYLDFNFSPTNLQALPDAVNHGDIYKSLTAGSVDNTVGKIDNFGGAYLPENGINTNGTTSWVRLGYLSFDSVAAGKTALTLDSGVLPFANQANIDWTKINFSSPELDVREACIYDLDSSGVVDLGDYAIFIKAFGSTAASENWNVSCDFDKNGTVNDADYDFFNNAFGKEAYDPTLVYPTIVTPTPAPVTGESMTESVPLAADPVATTITVTNTNDDGAGSLRQAINDIAEGGTITFASGLAGKTIRLVTMLDVTKSITIDASSLSSNVILSGNDKCRIFNVWNPKYIDHFKIYNLTLTNGWTSDYGGAVYMNSVKSVIIQDCIIKKSYSSNSGGGLYFYSDYHKFNGTTSTSSVEITGCQINDNEAKEGGGIGFGDAGDVKTLGSHGKNFDIKIKNCTVSNNVGTGGTGGILITKYVAHSTDNYYGSLTRTMGKT